MNLSNACVAISVSLGVVGCDGVLNGSDGSESAGASSGSGDGDGDSQPTGTDPLNIGCDIQAVMAKPENSCTASGCHGARPQAGLDLLGAGLEERIIGAVAQGDDCGAEPLINPASPDDSLLLRKIDPLRFGDGEETCGGIMPLKSEGVSQGDLECFERWVFALAEESGGMVGVSYKDEWVDTSPESYLAKVKALTNGGLVTTDELDGVRADPSVLSTYVEQWVETPGFEKKLKEFLEVALQQRLNGDLEDQTDGINLPVRQAIMLRQNVAEAFSRTAQKIVLEGRPFTEVATTQNWEMTTALMVLLSYTEMDDNEKTSLVHWFYEDNPPVGAPQGELTLEASINTGYWMLPGWSNTCGTRDEGAHAVLGFVFGRMFCGVGRHYFPNPPLVSGDDFSDWRTVEMRPTTDLADRVDFWNVPALRAANHLDVALPRVGFFTTPAFLGNWVTNEDNEFRVTTSQTMITALGREFSPGDLTAPATTAGLDEEHAIPGTSCYACHTLLDPMRNFFLQGFDFNYRRSTDPQDLEAGFSFRGAASSGGDVYELAAQVASHPLFGAAWVQKLCHYANSQACDENDPEFTQLVESFEASDYDFKKLFAEVMSSPLVTGAHYTETFDSRRWLISITRQTHLCQMLDERLGYENVCAQGSHFIGLIPEDEFARGQAEPVLTAVTGSFHFAAVDSLCSRLALQLVGNQGNRPFKLNDVDGSLALMVDGLLGLPEGHSRREEWRATLSKHYDDALAANATNDQALRSAFTLACSSPEVMALAL